MKRLVLATALAAFPIAVQAADLYGLAPAPTYDHSAAKAGGFRWAGFYLGANAGYLWADSNLFETEGSDQSGTFDRNGFVGGAQIGYNHQTGPWVLGLEADIQYSSSSGSTTVFCDGVCSAELNWFGTVRGRAGYAKDRLLIYATGGLALGGVRDSFPFPQFSSSETLTGWAAGGGAELGFAENWTAKAEYLYMNLGSSDSGPPGLVGGKYDRNHIFRVGVNYLFD